MTNYCIEKGKILTQDGVPYLPRWFCDDLVAYEHDSFGVSKVEYFNSKTKGQEKVFVDDMWGGIRFYINNNGLRKSLNLKKCEIMPYGFWGEWHYNDFKFRYEERVINDSIYISLKPLTGYPNGIKFAMEFYDNHRLITRRDGDPRYTSRIERVWDNWTCADNIMHTSYREDEGETHVAVSANAKFCYERRTIHVPKNVLELEITNDECIFVISFDNSKEKVLKRVIKTLDEYNDFINVQNSRYQHTMDIMPVLESPYKDLDNFFVLAPLYHESCKVQSLPGAIRAKNEHYWVWGWDGMSSSFAYAYWGDADYISELLDLYKNSADKDEGIGHWFARDMSHIQTSMISAQGFYISLLHQHMHNGGDVTPYYEFAKWIFELIAGTEVDGTGLLQGYSLMPDFRDAILETGEDLSAFNNSSSYCALRAMAEIADKMGDAETKNAASALADRLENSYGEILFNKEKGFFVASADAKTHEQRDVYVSPAIKWDNLYCYDLIKGKEKQLVDFFDKNFALESGLVFTPVWDKRYDADANQLHCYWPSNGECFTRLINLENRRDLIDKFIGWIECWTKVLMCPEGIDCYDDVNRPKPDGWNSVNGTWQTYSMRAWYEAIIHSVVGIDFAHNGMNIYPYDGEEMMLNNLHYSDKTFDIKMRGKGTKVKEVILNDVSLGDVANISMDKFKKHNSIEVIRGA